MRGFRLALLPLVLLGCEESPPAPRGQAPAAAPAAPAQAAALAAAEERLRARLRAEGALATRAVVVHRQALPGTLAVCGQVNATGRGEDPFIPWVAVIGLEGERVARAEFFLAASSAEATRVYFEMVDRCFDGGGPATARSPARPLPPAPAGMPFAAPDLTPQRLPALPAQTPPPAAQAMPAPGAAQAAGTPASGSVTTSQRTPVNLRSHPSGGGEILRVIPRGSTLQVFGQAPGGWMQVGEGEPWGWVHNSMLER
jgi:hypothetical protein